MVALRGRAVSHDRGTPVEVRVRGTFRDAPCPGLGIVDCCFWGTCAWSLRFGPGFQDPEFGFRVSGFRVWGSGGSEAPGPLLAGHQRRPSALVSGFEIRVWFRVSEFGYGFGFENSVMVSEFGIRVWFRVPGFCYGFGIRNSGMVSGFGIRVWSRVSEFGYGFRSQNSGIVSGLRIRVWFRVSEFWYSFGFRNSGMVSVFGTRVWFRNLSIGIR